MNSPGLYLEKFTPVCGLQKSRNAFYLFFIHQTGDKIKIPTKDKHTKKSRKKQLFIIYYIYRHFDF